MPTVILAEGWPPNHCYAHWYDKSPSAGKSPFADNSVSPDMTNEEQNAAKMILQLNYCCDLLLISARIPH